MQMNDTEGRKDRIQISNFTLERGRGKTPIEFTGWCIGDVHSRKPGNSRWTILRLYKTVGGNFVCSMVGMSTVPNETYRYKAESVRDERGVIEFFGHGWLANNLYVDVGIEAIERIE